MLSNFKDGYKFKIVNMVPVFVDNGSSYLSKLKNGLTLDYIIELELLKPVIETILVKDTNDCKYKLNSDLLIDNFDNDHDSNKHSRKGKYKDFMASKRSNPKKYKKILAGNNYKLFENNHLFQKDYFQEEKEKEEEKDDGCSNRHIFYSYPDDSDDSYDSYDSYYTYDSHRGYYYRDYYY